MTTSTGKAEPNVSWWVGLTREQLRQAVAERAEYFRLQQQPFLDQIGARMCSEDWQMSRRKNED
jgi:hypothetical protein